MLKRFVALAGAIPLLLLCVSCGDEAVAPVAQGDLQVAMTMAGGVPDGDGALVQVDDHQPLPIFGGMGVAVPDLPVGSHIVALLEVAEHCTVAGDNPRVVQIQGDQITLTTFEVTCGSPDQMSLADFVVAAGTYPEVEPQDVVVDDSTFNEWKGGAEWVCTKERHSVVDAPDEYATFNPNAEVIYPASMLQGATLKDATPEPVVVRRAGGTVVINLLNGSSGVAQHVDEVKQSTVVQAINDILTANSGIVPSRFTYRSSMVQSQEQLALELGVNVETLVTDLKTQLSINKSEEFNRVLVQFVQSFYTVSFDLPRTLADLFHPSVTAADLAPYAGPGNPPTYISSVTYGRRFVVLIESTASQTEIEAKVRASYDAAIADVALESETDYVKNLENVRIKVFALGGDQSLATAMFNGSFDAIRGFLTQGGDIETGIPLSYVVRNVVDNSVVNVKVATDYDVTRCDLVERDRLYSGFDEDAQGWTSYDNASGPVEWKSQTECNSSTGGCIVLRDAHNQNMRLLAPAAWNRDWTGFLGGTIHYVAKTNGGDGWTSGFPEVEIRGSRGVLRLYMPSIFHIRLTEGWTPLTVKLDADGSLVNYGTGDLPVLWQFEGRPATHEEMHAVLSDVNGLVVRAEYKSGTDYFWMDEFEIVGPDEEPVGGGYPGAGG